jgi:hypothetical protein
MTIQHKFVIASKVNMAPVEFLKLWFNEICYNPGTSIFFMFVVDVALKIYGTFILIQKFQEEMEYTRFYYRQWYWI